MKEKGVLQLSSSNMISFIVLFPLNVNSPMTQFHLNLSSFELLKLELLKLAFGHSKLHVTST